jgi:hypothetical protein
MVDCLRKTDAQFLIRNQEGLLDFWCFPLHTVPVIDAETRGADAFLHDDPAAIMESGDFTPIPIITGVTQDEGFMPYAILHAMIGNEQFTNQTYFYDELIPRVLRDVLHDEEKEEIEIVSEAVRRHYFHGLNLSDETSAKMAISELSDVRIEFFGSFQIYFTKIDHT